ncbi:hypothetical protein HELRODRAFT_158441 [Helobdella robusta]|uniref:Uncharacterized protein n=1 Tax=Helobdella robusta TaxID=6412 RepID=T1EMS6_HELRO|nr:hypothetical protein HELRODRAFT_158441 [Helobdella robusta]ESO12033.1 hypothetical protein HELRODRAFT_158441 [Helobdella robusta]
MASGPLRQACSEMAYTSPFAASNPSVQARLTLLEKQFILQREQLSRQFEEQCRLLDNEQQAKVQEYLKIILNQQQKDEAMEIKRKMNDDQMSKYKHKRKTEEISRRVQFTSVVVAAVIEVPFMNSDIHRPQNFFNYLIRIFGINKKID